MNREQVQEVLNQIDPALIEELDVPKKRQPRAWRAGLIAACLCAALVGTAVAAVPGLRERLTGWLGGFAPYTQDIEEVSCTEDGIEIKVVSAMADTAVVKVYAEVRDLEGDEINEELLRKNTFLWGIVRRDRVKEQMQGDLSETKCVSYDETSKTALIEITSWGMDTDLTGAELTVFRIDHVKDTEWKLPLTIEQVETRTVQTSEQVGGVELRAVTLSPLGLALETEGEPYPPSDVALTFKNGDTLLMEERFTGGAVSKTGRTVHWDFDNPVDIDSVAGVSIGGCYIPLDGDK